MKKTFTLRFIKTLLLSMFMLGVANTSFSNCPSVFITDNTFQGTLTQSGQSFTAVSTGKMTSVNFIFNGAATGTISVYAGETVEGTPIHTQPYDVSDGEQEIVFSDAIDIVAGQKYSIYTGAPCAYYPFGEYAGGTSFTTTLAFPGDLWMKVNMERPALVSVTDTIVSCGPYTWRDGITYNSDNTTAEYTVVNCAAGDTALTLHLTVINIEDKTLSTAIDGCYGEEASVDIASSEVGVAYYLRDNSDNSMVDGPVYGTGHTISLKTEVLGENTTTYNVYTKKGTLDSTALNFDGINDRVEVNTGSKVVSGSYTVEAWVKPNTTTGSMTILSTRLPVDLGFDFKLQNGNLIHGDIGSGSGWITTVADATFNYEAGQWYHLAYVVTETGYTIYADGQVIGSGTYSDVPLLIDDNHAILIGGYTSTIESFNGQIDEIRIWEVERTAQQIQNNYQTAIDPTDSGLVAYYDFHDGTGSATLSDLTPNNFDGTLSMVDVNTDWVTDPINEGTCFLQMTNTPVVSVTRVDTAVSQEGVTLTASASGTSYKWLHCSDNSVLDGETSQSFTATADGNYAVEVTQNTCVDTSKCFPFVVTALGANTSTKLFSVHPNPANASTLYFSKELTHVMVLDPEGRILSRLEKGTSISTESLSKGVYYLKSEEGIVSFVVE